MSVDVERVGNGFLVNYGDPPETVVVEGTNARTVCAKLGKAVIKALNKEEGTPDE
jgi:hypothetical protein